MLLMTRAERKNDKLAAGKACPRERRSSKHKKSLLVNNNGKEINSLRLFKVLHRTVRDNLFESSKMSSTIVVEVDMELARKFFAQKFSCGCSKSADDELTIQGDVVSELIDLLPEKWNQVCVHLCLILI